MVKAPGACSGGWGVADSRRGGSSEMFVKNLALQPESDGESAFKKATLSMVWR